MTDTAKTRVLIVDDEASIAKVLRKQLEVAGFEVDVAVDGEQGLAKIQGWRPAVVLLDVMLPKLSGYEVCTRVKRDEQLRRIPILMLTAKSQRQDQEAGMTCGAEAFLTKPFQLEELLAKVRGLLAAPGGAPAAAPEGA
jgi:DNA-binding response OmpR family regulator